MKKCGSGGGWVSGGRGRLIRTLVGVDLITLFVVLVICPLTAERAGGICTYNSSSSRRKGEGTTRRGREAATVPPPMRCLIVTSSSPTGGLW